MLDEPEASLAWVGSLLPRFLLFLPSLAWTASVIALTYNRGRCEACNSVP